MPLDKISKKSIRTSFYTCLYLCHSSCEIDASIGLSSGLSVYNHLNLHICKYTNSRACVRICNETRVGQFVVLLAHLYIILSEVNMPGHISRNAQTNGAARVHTCTIFSTGEDTLFLFLVAEHRLTFQSSQFLWHLALRPVDANVP